MLLSFVFKDSQQQHCLLRNMIIECHVRSDLSLPAQEPIKLLFQVFARYFTFLPAISLFARYFNKNSKTINQSDLTKQCTACNYARNKLCTGLNG